MKKYIIKPKACSERWSKFLNMLTTQIENYILCFIWVLANQPNVLVCKTY